ncbi:MAG TPA: CaiB/BaiF CoA-transferase family protein [Gemmatimonadaceae bacterium]|nr:CaiB/BaiF CoA-transferase family protein [Gemmatimonadaceae bacterium]
MSALPLEGMTVVALEHAVSGPLCTRHLADYGARVIKIERPEGDFARGYDESVHGLSSYFVWLNRGKESVVLDLREASGRDALDRLLARADVFVQNLGPGSAARLGVDYESLKARFPKLIVTDISGYGEPGPMRDKKAYDLLLQAEGGLLSVTGSDDSPARCGVSIVDIAAGMYAFSGTLLALMQRARDGHGTAVSVSMLDAVAEWMSQPVYFGRYGEAPPRRSGASHPTIAPYGPHRTGDGEVMLGIQNEREWSRFCAEVLEQPSLAADERFDRNTKRVANRGELTRIIEDVFMQSSSEQIVARLDAAEIANGRVNDVHGVAVHEQLQARGRWADVQTENGSIAALRPPIDLRGSTASMGDVPTLGQHTKAVLKELGL